MIKLFHYFIIFLILFLSGGIIVTINIADYFYPLLLTILFVSILIHLMFFKIPRNINFRYWLIFSFLFIALFLLRGESLLFSNNLIILAKLFLVLVLILYIKFYFRDSKKFWIYFVRASEFIIALSLVSFILGNLFPVLSFEIPTNNDQLLSKTYSIMGFGFYRMGDFLKYDGFIRNQGIYWEPGVLGVIIILTYIIKRYILFKRTNIIFYFGSILSTMSAGAIIIFSFLYISQRIKKYKFALIALLAILSGVLLVISGFGLNFIISIFSTLLGRDFASDSSSLTRSYDLYYGITAGVKNIWLGNGSDFSNFYNATMEAVNTSKEWFGGGITNSIVNIFYCYGIFMTGLYLHLLYKFSNRISKEYSIQIFIALILILMLEPLHLSLLFLLMILHFSSPSKKISYKHE